jgi:aquaporin Z
MEQLPDRVATATGWRGARAALAGHWPEYLIEAAALGTFMVSATVVTLAMESAASPLRAALPDADLRRALTGVCMGLTALLLIHSRWGRQSGAHMNPSVTLAFLSLGRVAPWDAVFYVLAQFLGGLAGVLLVYAVAGAALAAPEVNFAATRPGPAGAPPALAAEFAISAGMMLTVLTFAGRERWAPYTGYAAAVLVAIYIAIEAPLSGMSMNPARSLASALPGALFHHLWIYFVGPPLGMLAAAGLYAAATAGRRSGCAKLIHAEDVRCIHCGHVPAGAPSRPRPSPVTEHSP